MTSVAKLLSDVAKQRSCATLRGVAVISSLFVRKIVARAQAEGLDGRRVLHSAGLEESQLEGDQLIEADSHYGVWEAILRSLPERASGFPMRYARSMQLDDYGALGLAWKTAPSCREALERAIRYHCILTNTSVMKLSEEAPAGSLRLEFQREGARRLGLRCANEAALAEVLQALVNLVQRPVSAERVTFRHAPPPNVEEHERHFGCEIEWLGPSDAVQLSELSLRAVPRMADAGLSRFLLEHLDERAGTEGLEAPIEARVQRVVLDALPSGSPKMGDIAQRLGMSSRTLHRRLESNGASFNELVESTRRQLVEDLLARTQRPLGEVAFLAGFAEPSSFHRAFKRWTGATPASFRARRPAG